MKKIQEQKHFLALMSRPGDYVFIEISKLDIANGYNPSNLGEIDSFTMHFNIDEIMDSIKRANVVSKIYLEGTLVIADNQKHNPIQVIDKNYYNNFQINEFLNSKLSNKMFINNLINKFGSICNDSDKKEDFNNALKENNINKAIDILFCMPYLKLRKYIMYLIDLRNKETQEEKMKELTRDKAA